MSSFRATSMRLNARSATRALDQRGPAGNLSAGLVATFIVVLSLTFNLLLCFLNTNLIAVTSAYVVIAEVLILSAALCSSLAELSAPRLIVITVMVLYVLALALARATFSSSVDLDVKIARDLLIPFVFFLFGCRYNDLRRADVIVKISALSVVAIGLFEYFFLDLFLRYFNVIMYYIGRGSVEIERLEILSTDLFVSGIRPEGRSILPFLGDHRVSSIFLEPVSPGNFAVIIFIWALVRARFARIFHWSIFAAAVLIIILADNRFGAYLCGLSVVVSMLPKRFAYLAVAVLPLIVVTTLIGLAATLAGYSIDNGLLGRAVSAGRVLIDFDLADWWGLGSGSALAFDSGYAYTIGQIGIPGAVGMWLLFIGLRSGNPQFRSFRTLVGLYLGMILAVSYSPYTIKTGGLLWFLFGALYASRGTFAHRTSTVAAPAARMATQQA